MNLDLSNLFSRPNGPPTPDLLAKSKGAAALAAAYKRAAANLYDDPTQPDALGALAERLAEDIEGDGTLYGAFGTREPEFLQPFMVRRFEGNGTFAAAGNTLILTELTTGAGAMMTAVDTTRIICDGDSVAEEYVRDHAVRAIKPVINVVVTGEGADVGPDAAALERWLASQISVTGKTSDRKAGYFLFDVGLDSIMGGYELRADEYQSSLCNSTAWKMTADFPGVGEQAARALVDVTCSPSGTANVRITASVNFLIALDPYEVYEARCKAMGVKPMSKGF